MDWRPGNRYHKIVYVGISSIPTLIGGIARLSHRVQAKKRVFEIQQECTGAAKGKRKRELPALSMLPGGIARLCHHIAHPLSYICAGKEAAVEVVPNLEPLPKWALVQNILEVRILPRSAHVCTGLGEVSGSL